MIIKKNFKYSSMNYIDIDDIKDAEILYDSDDLVLLLDKSKELAMLHFATNDFSPVVKAIANIPDNLRLHFVPREYAAELSDLGFTEYAEWADFWNYDIAKTASRISGGSQPKFLTKSECEEVAAVSRQCEYQSRGFEAIPSEDFMELLNDGNKVIIYQNDSVIAGFCCVPIYNENTTLWIKAIAVDPEYQGQGIGKKLMGQAIKYGSQSGASKGFLASDLLNTNAHSLFMKFGFHPKETDTELQMIRQ